MEREVFYERDSLIKSNFHTKKKLFSIKSLEAKKNFVNEYFRAYFSSTSWRGLKSIFIHDILPKWRFDEGFLKQSCIIKLFTRQNINSRDYANSKMEISVHCSPKSIIAPSTRFSTFKRTWHVVSVGGLRYFSSSSDLAVKIDSLFTSSI